MAIVLVGVSHKTAALELREQLDIPDKSLDSVLRELRELAGVRGVFATSTCNRVEIYVSSGAPDEAESALRSWLAARADGAADAVDQALYTHRDESAIRHLFRVASSLDSMIVGEAQILGQVKRSFASAAKAGVLDGLLNRSLTRALRVAKKIRTKTDISRHAVSVPKVSIDLAAKIFGDLATRSVLLIGAGKVSEMAAKTLTQRGIASVHVANRSVDRAAEMAQRLQATAHGLDAIPRLLNEVDIVISSTGAEGTVLTADDIRAALPKRRYRPICIIDIAVPRDVEPEVGQLPNVYLFDIDDLQNVVDANMSERLRQARKGERIVADEAIAFVRHMRTDRVAPTIAALRKRLIFIKDDELAKTLDSLDGLSKADRKKVTKMANLLVKRILHEPTINLKELAKRGQGEDAIDLIERLFDLKDDT
jgi:glutamyl-tRNA reductase